MGVYSLIAISLGSYMDKAAGRRACAGKIFTQDVSVVSRSCLGRVSVLFWCCFVVFLVVFWGSFSDVLVTSRACFGEISVMCVDGAVMFMMMSG